MASVDGQSAWDQERSEDKRDTRRREETRRNVEGYSLLPGQEAVGRRGGDWDGTGKTGRTERGKEENEKRTEMLRGSPRGPALEVQNRTETGRGDWG